MVSLNLLYLVYRKIPDNVVSELYLFGFEPSMIIISLALKFCEFVTLSKFFLLLLEVKNYLKSENN